MAPAREAALNDPASTVRRSIMWYASTRRIGSPLIHASCRGSFIDFTRQAPDRMGIAAVENILSVLDGKPIRDNVLSKEVPTSKDQTNADHQRKS